MSRRRGSSGKPPRGLSPEDAALWGHIAETTEPLRKVKPRVPSHEEPEGDGSRPDLPRLPIRTSDTKPGKRTPAVPPPVQSHAPPLTEFDRKKAKKLAAGREAIEARIDLHGMRLSEAHVVLRAFLLASHAAGRRNILVITGKGAATGGEDATRPFVMDTRERGVLRRNVPIWLAEPELRAIVVSYTDAARGHGGSGALYVHLRARSKVGR